VRRRLANMSSAPRSSSPNVPPRPRPEGFQPNPGARGRPMSSASASLGLRPGAAARPASGRGVAKPSTTSRRACRVRLPFLSQLEYLFRDGRGRRPHFFSECPHNLSSKRSSPPTRRWEVAGFRAVIHPRSADLEVPATSFESTAHHAERSASAQVLASPFARKPRWVRLVDD